MPNCPKMSLNVIILAPKWRQIEPPNSLQLEKREFNSKLSFFKDGLDVFIFKKPRKGVFTFFNALLCCFTSSQNLPPVSLMVVTSWIVWGFLLGLFFTVFKLIHHTDFDFLLFFCLVYFSVLARRFV